MSRCKQRREIGSEFWEIPCGIGDVVFPDDTRWFASGRIALHYIIKDIMSKGALRRVALPSWCCESMIEPFLVHGIEVRFYPVTLGGRGIEQSLSNISDCDAVLVMDHFGYETLPEFDFDGVVIYDMTHSVFSGFERKADYYFGSMRKWAAFETGGFAYSYRGFTFSGVNAPDSEYFRLRRKAMDMKRDYMHAITNEKEYLSVYALAESRLEQLSSEGSICVSDVDAGHQLCTADTEFIRRSRRRNAAIIHTELKNITLFDRLGKDECPIFVPILLSEDERVKLRRYLIEREIYCPIHWPISDLHRVDDLTAKPYEGVLSLVCDQRYTVEDIKRMCDVIRDFVSC